MNLDNKKRTPDRRQNYVSYQSTTSFQILQEGDDEVAGPRVQRSTEPSSICYGLLNDSKIFKRKCEQRKLNSMVLYTIHACEAITEEGVVREKS
ncbi:ent-kaurene synthase [Ranunculus cassubicifolius]